MAERRTGWIWVALLAAWLAGCGGGGGGDDPAVREPLPPLSQDLLPGGERLDLRARRYFVAQAGDTWVYDVEQAGATTPRGATLVVNAVDGDDAWLHETVLGETSRGHWRRTAEGIVSVATLAGAAPPAVVAAVGDLLEYPEPFYAVGAERLAIRQGSWGEDLDGDGRPESFRLEIGQVLVGFETLALPRGSAETAHFRSVVRLTLVPSQAANAPLTLVSTEHSWWAPGLGRVRVERGAVDGGGQVVEPVQTLRLVAATVGGVEQFQAQPDGTVTKLALPHRALVYDRLRGLYYASVPARAGANGNRIAVIDAASGTVQYSPPVGSDPGALALAADGSALHVALDGSGEVVHLNLPAWQEARRTRLPVEPIYGQLLAEQLAVSPVDASVVAVSLRRTTVSPRHGGVALVRAGVLQPRMTQPHTGSNLIAFAGDGQWLYGYDNESSGFGLRRIELLADGLAERSVVATGAGYGPSVLDATPQGPLLGDTLYRGSDLATLGRVAAPGGSCRPAAAAPRLLCLQELHYGAVGGVRHVVVADAASFTTLDTPAYALRDPPTEPVELLPGPPGQVALRIGPAYAGQPATALWLFSSARLP